MNLSKIKKLFTKSYSFNLIFLIKNRFHYEKVRISPKKWTSKFENALFLLAQWLILVPVEEKINA